MVIKESTVLKFVRCLSLLGLVFASAGQHGTAHAASPGTVVINEIMYNPASNVDGDEFLELHNTTGSPVSLNGWCITSGVALCLSSGVTISSHGYIVISPNAVRTQSTYGIATVGTYTGKLDNGGETLTLKDDLGNTISSLNYDDATPWPASPDGAGPSLELMDASTDIALPSSWGGSPSDGGTPGSINGTTLAGLPVISNVSKPTGVVASTAPAVTARIVNSSSASLVYKVMFGGDQTIAMYDDGTHADGSAGDGVFGATIPAQASGKMVRYKISATNSNGSIASPGSDNTIDYYGYTISDAVNHDLPQVRWYMDPSDYIDMTTNHLTDDLQFPAVVAFGDQFFDNSLVRVKGQSSTSFEKRKYKFDLPPGYSLGAPAFDIPIDEFSIQTYFLNMTDFQEGMAWKAAEKFGFKPLQNRYVRVNRNAGSDPSQYIGHYLLIETYDKSWRERNGYESGALYKQGNDKKTRLSENNSDIQSLQSSVTTLQGDALKAYLLDNLDIPALVNYHALSAVAPHDDWHFLKNLYQYRDTDGTGRWEYLPWDLDNSFTTPSVGNTDMSVSALEEPIMGVLKTQYSGAPDFYNNAIIERAMYQFPEFREMFFRRSMQMYDQVWNNNQYIEWFDEFHDLSRDSVAEDLLVWNPAKKAIYQSIMPGGLPFSLPEDFPFEFDPVNFFDYLDTFTPEDSRELYLYGANRYKNAVAAARVGGRVLGGQTGSQESRVQISEIHYDPQGDDASEFVEIHNNAVLPVDISGWSIVGLDYEFSQGTVLPAGGYGVIVANDVAFRAAYPSVLVLGQYEGNMSNSGQSLAQMSGNSVNISSVTYGVADPWPSISNGQGYSLSLIRSNADEALAACWAPSQSQGGTPGQGNTLNAQWVEGNGSGCTDRIYQTSSGESSRDLAGTGVNAFAVIAAGLLLVFVSVAITKNNGYVKIR